MDLGGDTSHLNAQGSFLGFLKGLLHMQSLCFTFCSLSLLMFWAMAQRHKHIPFSLFILSTC